jgi:hypothetical protein
VFEISSNWGEIAAISISSYNLLVNGSLNIMNNETRNSSQKIVYISGTDLIGDVNIYNNITGHIIGTSGLGFMLRHVKIFNNDAKSVIFSNSMYDNGLIDIDSSMIVGNISNDSHTIYCTGQIKITNSIVSDNISGYEGVINNGDRYTYINNTTLCNNVGQNNFGGLYTGPSSEITNSNLINNGISVQNSDNSGFINATNNYWGASSGPYHPSQNPTGIGDSVGIFVNVDPWLTTPNTDAPPIPAQNTTITSSGNDFISLSWDASELSDLAGYKVYYDTDEGGYPYENSIDVGNVTSHTLSGLALGTTYHIAVTTVDTDGNESWYSNEVTLPTSMLFSYG